VVIALVFACGLGEVMLRLKNLDQNNYAIEMWRYSRELKRASNNPLLGHEHKPSTTGKFQGVKIRINSLGMRGPEPDLSNSQLKRIVFIGSSATLGWGTPEPETITARIAKKKEKLYQVFNAGIGNYNAARYVLQFEEKLRYLKPDIVVVHYFINDAEIIPLSNNNILLLNSQLAASLYLLWNSLRLGATDTSALREHYRNVYDHKSKGFLEMRTALDRLDSMAREDNFQVIFTIVPDIHQLRSYPFRFIHDTMRNIVSGYDWKFIDFLESFRGYEGPELGTIPGDPHPNSTAHKIMADVLERHLD